MSYLCLKTLNQDVIENGQTVRLEIRINNVYPIELKNGEITMDGFGTSKSIELE